MTPMPMSDRHTLEGHDAGHSAVSNGLREEEGGR